MADLTPKQKMFCEEYTIDLNGTQAAIRAGYSEKTANEQAARLLTNVSVKEYVQSLMDKRSERIEITADYVLKTIHKTVERCQQSYPVLNRKGEQVYCEGSEGQMLPAYTFDASGVLKGCELLGKHLKIFTDKVEHSGQVALGTILQDIDGRSANLPED